MARFVCPACGGSQPSPGHCTEDGAALADAGDDVVLGSTLGSWRVTQLLGAGGMGRVYLGVHPGIGSRVAIKVLAHEVAASPAAVERFFGEARAVNLIRHEHIVNVIDLAQLPDGRPFIVMEHLDGRALSDLIAERGALPLGWLARLSSEILDALAAAHERGIVHRDLKPDNIFVSPGGHAKVLDFGIAKLRGDELAGTPQTVTGALLGTPHYMSPEQALGQKADPRSDIYSLGVLVYECTTGRKPFGGDALFELLRAHIEQAPAPPSSIRPGLPPGFEQIVLRALQKDPALRFQSAREMHTALATAMAFLPSDSFQPPPVGASQRAEWRFVSAPPGAGSGPGPTRLPTAVPQASTTHGAVATTLRSGGAPSSSILPWIAALGFGALALGAVGIAAFVLWPRADAARPVVVVNPPTPPSPPSVKPGRRAPIEPAGLVTEATQRAQSLAADAALLRIEAFHVGRDGRVDFSRSDAKAVFTFISPSRAKRWATEPLLEKKTQCIVRIDMGPKGDGASFTDSDCDDEIPLPKPRCDFSKIMKKAARAGAPADADDAELVKYTTRDDEGTPEWFAQVGTLKAWFPDEC